MAKIELKFKDIDDDDNTIIKVYKEDNYIKIIVINEFTESKIIINLDKSTAIKFAKTLRTEINKIQE